MSAQTLLPRREAKTFRGHTMATEPLDILVVDDSRDCAESLAMILRMEGHCVRALYSGADAYTSFVMRVPDVAILDLEMPELDGFTLAKKMRVHALESVMLIALTGWGRTEDREATRRAGFDLHFVKPVHPRKLFAALTICGGRAAQPSWNGAEPPLDFP